jgi:small subunit ribosomal protein S20
MPIKKAGFKDLRQSKARALKNKKVKENLTYLIKKSRKLLENKDVQKASEWILKAVKALDRAAQKGVIKKNTASRKKSRLAKKLNSTKK